MIQLLDGALIIKLQTRLECRAQLSQLFALGQSFGQQPTSVLRLPVFWKPRINKRQPPGPTGTGQFYDVLDWWFWDDATTPGFVTSDRLEQLSRLAIPTDEQGEYALALTGSRMVTNGKRSSARLEARAHYFSLMSDYLISIRTMDTRAINDWVCAEWEDNCFAVIKAYISVLEFWNYSYRWQEIFDARSDPALLILHDGKPAYCVLENDIQSIRGRPLRFAAETVRATWRFDVADPQLTITSRIRREDYVEGRPIVRRNTVGSDVLTPISAIGMDALWPEQRGE